jgi:asparagine synthase (glutamine-hydrolysing)
MCGIAGILSLDKNIEKLQERVLLMRSFLSHRGPDDVGLYIDENIALAHSRLSIIDLAGGHQPLHNEDKTIYLVANGEIYNYKSLRKKLLSQGQRLRTQSDCEVIVHLYEDEGESCVRHLDGMFAFALWDARQRKSLLVRDRLGIKPLYVATSENHFCFASELSSIIQSGLIKTEVDPQALYSYLTFSYVPAS